MKSLEILTQSILPIALHGINPRTAMGTTAWNKMKKEKQALADHHCMACGEYVAHVAGNYLECHEVYDFDIANHTATIKDYVCLCKDCHNYIHQGRLRMLLQEGTITLKEYERIINRGNKLLERSNLKKIDLPSNELEYSNWKMIYNGKILEEK